jgi:hypothetical protein
VVDRKVVAGLDTLLQHDPVPHMVAGAASDTWASFCCGREVVWCLLVPFFMDMLKLSALNTSPTHRGGVVLLFLCTWAEVQGNK